MSISSVLVYLFNVMAIPLLIFGWLLFLYRMCQDEEQEEFVDDYIEDMDDKAEEEEDRSTKKDN